VFARLAALCAVPLVALWLATAAHASNPQIAGLQVALRAYGLYSGPIDAVAGPAKVRATKTRRALGPLGRPLFGRRTLRVGTFGWDVSVLQFLLRGRGQLVPVDGYFDGATARALRRYQHTRRLHVDGIAGPHTLRTLARGRPELLVARRMPWWTFVSALALRRLSV
jgi:peptidoglycan hydrolase-like protein with peptidoglycan-binding domain